MLPLYSWQSRAVARVYFFADWPDYVYFFFYSLITILDPRLMIPAPYQKQKRLASFVGTHPTIYMCIGHRLCVSRRIHRFRAACRPFTNFIVGDVLFARLLPILDPPENYLYVSLYSTRATIEILAALFTCLGFCIMGLGFLNSP